MTRLAKPTHQFRTLVVSVLAFSFSGAGQLIAQPSNTAAPAADPKAVKAQLVEAFAALEDAAGQIPAETSDPVALIEKIGRDPATLFAWVRDNTHFAPYRGSLRGAAGVLQDRLGSSLDRSLLLAELLRAAGFEARLAQGAVTDAAKVAGAIRPIPANWLTSARPADASAELTAANQGAVAQNAAAAARVAKHSDELIKQLAASGLAPQKGQASQPAAIADVLADHWWVQLKQAEQWIDADPTLPTAKLGDRIADAKTTVASPSEDGKLKAIPAESVHTVDFKVVVERLEGGKLLEASPLTLSLRPAELQGKRVVYTHIPVAYKTPTTAPLPQQLQAMTAVSEYIPAFIIAGASTVNDAVTDAGQINSNPNLDRTAGMGKATGSTLGGLGGGLAGDSDTAQAAGIWTAEWLEMTVRTPGKPARTIRREVFDLVGPAARAKGAVTLSKLTDAVRLDRALTLVGETDILAFGAQPTQEFLASQYAQALLKAKRRVLATLDARIAAAGKDAKIKPIDFDPRTLALSPAWGAATGRFAVSPVAGDVYLDSTNVFTLARFTRATADGKVVRLTRTDLAVNDVAVRSGVDAFVTRVKQGVADTVVEAGVVETMDTLAGEQASKAINTVNLLEGPDAALVALPGRAADLSVWPTDARTRAEQSVAGGAVLIATAKPSASTVARLTGQVGWWKVDPATGSTIGVTGDGFHAATTERQQIENKVNGLLDIPFRLSVDEMKSYSQKEFIQMVCGGKGLNGLQLLRAFQNAARLHELILLL
ncbi:transglutaminase domain-containing protein [Humisphaera borealis]|uniref:Transglutaminase-like domain-containing protein n=1 Tax=Humisphaera borealis TaxID=2807512 RepID=A0A7M2WY16_9BACT|nr:transglutaminase domain-containing protein [Humisphaera borealis]QOV89701.1 hypothetical protein IPV69_26525 [Humisphaera borealis]